MNPDKGMLYWEDSFPEATEEENAVVGQELTRYTHVSLLINDVERYLDENQGSLNMTQLISTNEFLNDLVKMATQDEEEIDLYLRIARYDPLSKKHGDYTKAYILSYPGFNLTMAAAGVT